MTNFFFYIREKSRNDVGDKIIGVYVGKGVGVGNGNHNMVNAIMVMLVVLLLLRIPIIFRIVMVFMIINKSKRNRIRTGIINGINIHLEKYF